MSVASRLDRGLHALFSRHADSARHDRDRDRYRGAGLTVGFDTYLARIYGISWLVAAVLAAAVAAILLVAPVDAATTALGAAAPGDVSLPSVPRLYSAVAAGVAVGAIGKRATVASGGAYLRWRVDARRTAIERTLPGAVRYLRALADGSEGRREMLRRVAKQDAYGETSAELRRVLRKAELTGSLDSGLRSVARETPSRELLSPFLLKFREHANQGSDALQGYLRMESRMLSHQRSRERQRAGDYLELLAELFIVLLVLPALLVIIVTVMSVLAPGLSRPVPIPGEPTMRALLVYGSAAFVLVVGGCAAALVVELRPANHGVSYDRPGGLETLVTATTNPASAAVVFLPPASALGGLLWWVGEPAVNVALLGYAAYGLPVGAISVRRARLDDAKDREIRDFVHAVAGHVSLGKPFDEAVQTVAEEVDFGPLQADVDDLAFRLGLTTGTRDGGTRREALDRFVERVGTPLSEQTVGLVTGALSVGSDAETTFETLQTEIGSLYHQRKKLRSAMAVYVAVGWTTALLVVGIVVAVNAYVLDGFAQLSSVSGASGVAIDPEAVDIERDAWRFYVVTQATMLACGWFAGVASRSRYEALLHSSALVVVCYLVFAGAGMI
ncbi:type IV pilus biogenesis complex membrane subunit [Natronomonas pharaonis DSM 2160]|uniref:Type IV pilus biogenesis complex membrane subunit n=1 Tax=Natronomonas pharaonis (strain ATCC 35678 / DSM 2160 / CIP 103997 / JCM 8858 / NBRC 14720 / NCIMB 2260 / Gabara) TaxID=348780 RepID=Q3IUL0_NATPD|nr:type II secretion system F family protein [Natronomonas pharaonis]CAI48170.1 type IV pilus biogenesis complex membrane subunit [Natronomonas pharaonis DSM 2160]